MNPIRSVTCLAATSVLLAAATLEAAAVDIRYNLTGGNTYQYEVVNNSLPSPVIDFVIYFPTVSGPGEYTALGGAVLNSPATWTAMPVEPSAIMLNGYVDWYTAGAGIAMGTSLSGFEISFSYAGGGVPGAQFFEVYDSGFNVVDSGWTTPVPEPESTVVIATAILVASVGLRLRRGGTR